MQRDQESLIDMANAIKRILQYTDRISESELASNNEKLSAILYQIIILGEATNRLSPKLRQEYSEIPWREIAGMRDVIVHEYDQLDFDVIWDVVSHRLPELLTMINILIVE